MADPVTVTAIITGLVGAFKAYTEYKAATAKAGEQGKPAPEQSKAAAQGEAVAKTVKEAVTQHGEPKDARAVESFEEDPEVYQQALEKVLARLAERSPAFATQLQTLAQHEGIAPGAIQGTVNVSDTARVNQAAGVNTGTMTYQAGREEG